MSIFTLLFLISCGGGGGSEGAGGVVAPPVQTNPPRISTITSTLATVYTVDDVSVDVGLSSAGGSATFTFKWTVNGLPINNTGRTLASRFFRATDLVEVEVTATNTAGTDRSSL